MNETNPPRICIPVCEQYARNLTQAIARAAVDADVIELRLDCLLPAELDAALRDLRQLLRACSRPVILTLRPAEQGGHRELNLTERRALWSNHIGYNDEFADFADIELDLASDYMEREELAWDRVICSHHDFAGVPADLEKIYERMAATPARILKIAVQANDATDCLPVFHLLERARREKREMIAIAMGEAGIATRILAPSRGAFLTYGASDETHRTAPGQIGARELRELYRVHQLDEQTEITGLIGSPVKHSVSPHIHNAAFAACGLNAVYIPFEVRDLSAFVTRMAHPRTRESKWNLRGFSVTAPHKSAVMQHLDWIDNAAREIGAVNTIVIKDDALHGYNTDAAAFLAPLQEKLNNLRDANCAIIGAGGAARGALWSLRKAGARLNVFARNQASAQTLADEFGAHAHHLAGASFKNFDVVINSTPLGTRGINENDTPAVATQLQGARIAYDLVYNPCETLFLREASAAGCKVIGGLSMLVNQAAAQFELWTNETPVRDVMREAAEQQLMKAE